MLDKKKLSFDDWLSIVALLMATTRMLGVDPQRYSEAVFVVMADDHELPPHVAEAVKIILNSFENTAEGE